uniref:Uncharacterized protein n=1 Tax=Setaria viridis TaxID=4556 RepID=A0A4U6W0Q5_SETVI|nr:hypothetical protein SEVIR_2G409600v2 [Setaria viridis]
MFNPKLFTSSPPGSDAWVTMSAEMRGRTYLAFACVSTVHLRLLTYLRFDGGVGAIRIATRFAWIVPTVFWISTMAYFYYYITMTRYGVTLVEWITMGAFSFLILVLTLVLIIVSFLKFYTILSLALELC